MLQRLLFGLITVTSLTLVGCAHSPQQLNPQPTLKAQLAPVGHGQPRKTFAVALGCDLQHAERLVYSLGLDVQSPGNSVSIGPGCRVCPREDCMQRAFAQLPGR